MLQYLLSTGNNSATTKGDALTCFVLKIMKLVLREANLLDQLQIVRGRAGVQIHPGPCDSSTPELLCYFLFNIQRGFKKFMENKNYLSKLLLTPNVFEILCYMAEKKIRSTCKSPHFQYYM